MASDVIVRDARGHLFYFRADETPAPEFEYVRDATALERELADRVLSCTGFVPNELAMKMRRVMNNAGVEPRPNQPDYLRLVA